MSLFRFFCILGVLFTTIVVTPVHAQEYPNKPVHVIIPYGAGGSTDILGRIIFDKVGKNMGAVFVVDNKPGAGGQIGVVSLVKSSPDGYTLLVDGNPPFIQPAIMEKMPYDTFRDLAPVAYAARIPSVLVVTPKLPVKTVPELFEYAKSKKAPLTFGCSAMGNLSYFAGEMLIGATGGDIEIVSGRGSAQIISDMLAGYMHLTIDNLPPYLPQIRADKFRALATTGDVRATQLPDLPTMIEAGYPEFHISAKFGVYAPTGTPRPIIEKLGREIIAALKSADVQNRLVQSGFEPVGLGPEELWQTMKAEAEKWMRVAKERNIKKMR